MNKIPSLKDVILGKPMVEESASRVLNMPLTLSNVFNLVGSEIDELTKWKPGPGATKQRDPERAYSDEHAVLDPSGEPTGERFSSDTGAHTVDPERVADDEVVEDDLRIKDPDEKEIEDAEADDTLQYTGVTHFGEDYDDDLDLGSEDDSAGREKVI